MTGLKYVALGLALMTASIALSASNSYINALPSILHRASAEFSTCEQQAMDKTVMQQLACAKNISFADIRKLDMRTENMNFARRNGQVQILQARKS